MWWMADRAARVLWSWTKKATCHPWRVPARRSPNSGSPDRRDRIAESPHDWHARSSGSRTTSGRSHLCAPGRRRGNRTVCQRLSLPGWKRGGVVGVSWQLSGTKIWPAKGDSRGPRLIANVEEVHKNTPKASRTGKARQHPSIQVHVRHASRSRTADKNPRPIHVAVCSRSWRKFLIRRRIARNCAIQLFLQFIERVAANIRGLVRRQ